MTQSENPSRPAPHVVRSLIAVILGSLVLRAAASAMGENIQFYFAFINEAAQSPNHPLRTLAGATVQAIPYTLMGIIIASFFAAELFGSPIFGAWSDRYGRKLFIIFGPLFGAIAVQITAMTTIVWLLVITRLLEGLSTASNAPSTLGYIAEATSHSQKLRSRVVGFFEIATIGGAAAGFSIGGWLWHNFGTPAVVFGIPLTSPAFALNAIVYLVSLAILWFGMHEVVERKHVGAVVSPAETWRHYWKIISSPRVASFVPAWIAINAVLGIFLNLTARILTDKENFPGQVLVGAFNSLQAGNILAIYATIFVLGILVWSVGFSQAKKTTVMLIGTGGLFGTCLVLYLINHQPSLNSPMVIPLVIGLVFTTIVQSGFTPAALAHLADITEEHATDRGAIMGLYSVFLGIGQVLGASLGGPFIQWAGVDGIVTLTTLLGIFAALLLVRLAVIERGPSAQPGSGQENKSLSSEKV